MSWPSRLRILFCIQVFFGLCNAIVSNEDILKNMSPEEKKSFFGTEDGSIPDFEVVELREPPRSKRGTQEPLKITFNYMNILTTAILNVVEDHELFSPTGTGIWFAESNAEAYNNVVYTPRPDIFERIGNYDFFQNVDECSAITKFWTADGHITMSGVLKQDYGVRTVAPPYEEGLFHIKQKRAVEKRSTNSTEYPDDNSSLLLVIYKLPEIPQKYLQNPQNSSFLDLDLHRKRRQNAGGFNLPNIVYPKLLISPDFQVISVEKTVEESVQQLIAHFNAVDMMYRQVTRPMIRLKIGGLIIPRDAYATPYIAQDTAAITGLDADVVLTHAQNYFTNEHYRIKYDTYSAIIMLTMNTVWVHDTRTGNPTEYAGYAMIATACHDGRAIVKYMKGFQGVFLVAHEIGHVFSAEHDDGVKTRCLDTAGFAMADNAGKGRSLRWSICSLEAFYKFFGSPDASCTHTRPREVPDAIKSMQGAWLSLTGQCRNVQKDADNICLKAGDICREIGCRIGDKCIKQHMKPMEGSLVAIQRVRKRCINEQWVPAVTGGLTAPNSLP